MLRTALLLLLASLLPFAGPRQAHARSADVLLDPAAQSVAIGSIVEVRVELSGSAGLPQSFDVVDVIFSWDPTVLDLIEASQSGADYVFFVSGFLPNPDGINTNLDDGLAMFTGLGPPGLPQVAPPSPQTKTVTTLRFQTLSRTPETVVDIVPAFGTFSLTRVLLTGANVTGSIDSMALIEVVTPLTCPGDGSCFQVHPGAACDDAGCCEVVCTVDAACCADGWDALCVAQAFDLCDACGDPAVGSCFSAHATPFCDDQECCQTVCVQEPSCCETSWDELCKETANALCGDCGAPEAGSCFCAHPNVGCDSAPCCRAVCELEPVCCGVSWDQGCADQASGLCGCRFDFDGDGIVDGADLGLLLAAWGTSECPFDADDDGTVDGADLGLLLAEWGPCV